MLIEEHAVQRIQGEPVVWYFHPWELDEFQPDVNLGPLQNLRSQGGKRDLHAKLARALQGQEMVTVGELAASFRDDAPVLASVDQIPAASAPV